MANGASGDSDDRVALEQRVQRLRAERVLTEAELPPEYEAVIAGLTPDEVEVIVAVNQRINEANRTSGVDPRVCFFPF